jgi:hypothetical protein
MENGGFGWFIAQRVVEEHGGRIRVESGEGNYAFSIELSIEEERRTTVMLGREALPEPPTQLLTSAIDRPSRQTEMMPAQDPAGSAQEMDCPTRRLCPQLRATAIFRQRHDSVPNGEGRGF